MAYGLPSFNLDVNGWRWANWETGVPPGVAPDYTVKGQLRLYRTAFLEQFTTTTPVTVALLVAKGTDIRGVRGWFAEFGTPDLVEVPAGSGRYYTVAAVDDVARGFANEYRMARITQNATTLPLP